MLNSFYKGRTMWTCRRLFLGIISLLFAFFSVAANGDWLSAETQSIWPVLFAPAQELSVPVNSLNNEQAPTLSADGLSMIFTRSPGPLGGADLMQCARPSLDSAFSEPAPILNVDSSRDEVGGTLSPDGLELYFSQGGNPGYWDIVVAKRSSPTEDFGTPVNVGSMVNSEGRDQMPHLSSDGLILYFNRELVPQEESTMRLFTSMRSTTTSPWEPAVVMPGEINNDFARSPSLTADGLTIFFVSNRAGGFGGFDIWAATRSSVSQPWSAPVNLGPNVNTAAEEYEVFFSKSDQTLYFSRMVGAGIGSNFDIFFARAMTPSIDIATPRKLYYPGETLKLYVMVANPEYLSVTTWVHVWLELPDGSKFPGWEVTKRVTLPPRTERTRKVLEVGSLPSGPPGYYTFHGELHADMPSAYPMIAEDLAQWELSR